MSDVIAKRRVIQSCNFTLCFNQQCSLVMMLPSSRQIYVRIRRAANKVQSGTDAPHWDSDIL